MTKHRWMLLLVAMFLPAALAVRSDGQAQDTRRSEEHATSSCRTLNYAEIRRGGVARAFAAGKEFPADKVFDGDWLQGWIAPEGTGYPAVIHRDLGQVVRVNRLAWRLGPEILACPVVYTHNVNAEGTGVGNSTKVANWLQCWIGSVLKATGDLLSELLHFLRTKQLPSGVTKPMVLLFCTGQRGVYEHAFPELRQRRFKFVSTCWELEGQDNRFLTPHQIREMLQSGLFEPGIYTKWTTHRFGPDEGPVTGNTTVAFPRYDAGRNEYEPFGQYEERIFEQAGALVRSLRSDFGYSGEVVWEVPSSFYNLTMLRVARRRGIAMLVNLGRDLNIYGAQAAPNPSMVGMAEQEGTLADRQSAIASLSGAPVVRQYRYEVYISAAVLPFSGEKWESCPYWLMVVFERPGAGSRSTHYPLASQRRCATNRSWITSTAAT